ncbi:D-ribose transporter ATP-binding protein [Aureimonas sp. Leaf454]|uniref:sugar ABC transporter ATP-binding protein n=1 Tax=Aureimonas sp. Leaf454 TaxID=1736381 RepID=UPI0006F8BC0A|nr:sugar ABC transporter ATP-binding protein [Aureimonas sp. Leaf454]KQT46398.1 D-ribose transporter ATP-binding protein [Aureimonas sp. Leaf454]
MSDMLLELRSIHKAYNGVTALDGVSLSVGRGEVLGLVGENGAGKSTLMKILGGVIPPTSGSISVDGTLYDRLSVNEAARQGIAFVHQELNLFENLDVASNVFIGREPRRGGLLQLVDTAEIHRRVVPILSRLGVDFGPSDAVENLSIAQRQMVEIAKALSQDARVIIMDEPTSSLTLTETARLLKVVADLRRAGVGIIYISHRLGEIEEIADRVVVLRDGRVVGELLAGSITHAAMIRLMIGRDLKSIYLPPSGEAAAKGLEVEGMVTRAYPDRRIDLAVRRGEIVGLAGLVGAGRTELVEAIFGVDPPLAGEIRLDGRPIRIGGVADAIAHGIYLAPEDRKRCGLIVEQSLMHNMTLADLGHYARLWLVDGTAERRQAEVQRKRLGIKAESVAADAMTLSGGNQQKIVLGKWLSMSPSVMIFDEPTRGIDVGAKSEIYRIMRDLADSGVAILMVSSDMEEVIGVSDRVVVMHEGRIGGHLERHAFSEHNVLALATGQNHLTESAHP